MTPPIKTFTRAAARRDRRGFSTIALHQPKTPINVGAALRAADVYGVAALVTSGQRYKCVPTDTTKAFRRIPLIRAADVFDAIPFSCVPVAVELVDGATPLPEYEHPERAFYIFGAEDGGLGAAMIERCRDVVYIPTCAGSMNLAATVNVVLYDRMSKRGVGIRRRGPAEGETPR